MTPQTIVIVKDKKPTSAVRDGVSINFTITKAGYDQLVLSHPDRYEIVSEYLNKKQLAKKSASENNTPAAPEIVEIKDGINSQPDSPHATVSTDLDVKAALKKIKEASTIEELNLFFDEKETRKTVVAAYEIRYSQLPE